MKLLKVDTLAQARERLIKAAKECLPETEQVALADASDRILAEDIVSGEMIPAFRRSSVDGYAVCSKDTAGATESIPVFLKVLEEVDVKGISHITGGGFYENIPRSLKKGCCARIKKEDVRAPALFHLMQKTGNISEHDMFNTFNMGVGMIIAVAKEDADKALEVLAANGEDAVVLGEVISGNDGVVFE